MLYEVITVPYGIASSNMTSAFRNIAPNIYAAQPVVLRITSYNVCYTKLLRKVDTNWKTYIAEALASGVFESNSDNALYHYSSTAPEYCMFYEGFYIDARNDFTVSRPFMDILKGQADTLNVKSHPWEGVEA